MARRALLVPLAVLAAAGLAVCSVYIDSAGPDRGPQTTQDRTVTEVGALDFGASGDVRLHVGPPALAVTGGERVLDDLTTQVQGDTLVIDLDERWHDPGHLTYDLTMPALSSIRFGGSGEVTGDVAGTDPAVLDLRGSGRIDLTGLAADDVQVTVVGSGEVVVDRVAATSTVVDIGGSGRVQLTGATGSLEVSIPGSGAADVSGLAARDARVSIGGSGAARVNASETLDASIYGSGAITYTGEPRVTSNVSGSGAIVRG